MFVDADATRVKQVLATVAQSEGPAPDMSVTQQFFDRIAEIDMGVQPSTIRGWIDARIASGGQEDLDGIFVTLDPFGAVSHLSLFVKDA